MINSMDAAMAISRERGHAVVVGTMTPNRYWEAVTTEPDLDLPIFGAMGKASSVALGLALACPDKKVVVLDGDGAMLMNLGGLVTIAEQAPENLVHFVFEDGVYQTTGSQPVPGAGKFHLAEMARSAGISESFDFSCLEDFATELPDIMRKKGPVFVCLKVDHPEEPPEFHMGSTGQAMKRLSAHLSQM